MTPGAEVVTRPISAAQAATRHRLLDAARELATEGGYEAVGMRNVAARAGVSAPTAYQYFSSKDHLLVDLLVELVGQTTTTLSARTRPEGSPVERTVATLRHAVQQVEQASEPLRRDDPRLHLGLARRRACTRRDGIVDAAVDRSRGG